MIKSDVAKRVSTALAEDERTAEFDLNVVDEQGMITLMGSVATPEARAVVEEIAAAEEGVIEVINDLVVEPSDIGDKLVPPPPDLSGGTSRKL